MVKDIGNKKVKSAATERREQFLKEFFPGNRYGLDLQLL